MISIPMRQYLPWRFPVLLVTLILLLVIQPTVRGFSGRGLVFDVLYSLVLLAAILLLYKGRWLKRAALILGLPALLGRRLAYMPVLRLGLWLAWSLAMAQATCMAAEAGAGQGDVRESDMISSTASGNPDLPTAFNGGASFVVSINRFLPGSRALRADLVQRLREAKLLDRVVFEWFGDERLKPQTCELHIGRRVPVAMAQAALRACTDRARVPVVFALSEEDGDFGSTQRVYIGALVASGKDPIKPEQLRALLKEGLTQEEFLKIAREM